VGIPGVGKTTVISRVAEKLKSKGYNVAVAVFGTVMFEEAQKKGLRNRDEMRKLAIHDQRALQDMAAKRIAEMNAAVVIIDTHLFVRTYEGYYPGIPMRLLNILKPTNLIMITASANEIVKRRSGDDSRQRDMVSIESIENDLDISKVMVATCSAVAGSPFVIVMNDDNRIEEAACTIVKVLTGDK
jgi:adenylate kinase